MKKGKIHSKSLSRYLAVQAIFNQSFGFDQKQIEKEFVTQNDFKFYIDSDFDFEKKTFDKVFFKKRKNLIYFDLSKYVKLQLKLMKIANIETINIDTFPKKNNFFSARRSLHLNHDDYGRNISLIMIN